MHPGISFRQLQVFVTVARSGTVGAASQALSLSQSATSQSLADLERHLGMPLFQRIGKRLQLNELGRRLLPRAEHLLYELEVFIDSAREPEGELQGTLTISTSATIGTYLVPALVGRFAECNPGVDLQVRLRNTDEVVADLLRFDADLGLIEGQCNDSRLQTEVWRRDEMVIVCSPRHPLAALGRLEESDLQREPWILREPGSGSRAVFEAAIAPHAKRIKVRMELSQHEAIKQAVRAGYGLGCLSRLSVAGELERGELCALDADLQLHRTFLLVWHPERYCSPLWQAFKVFLREDDGGLR